MDKIQQLIIDTYQSKPRNYSQILGKNKEVLKYVKLHTDELNLTSFIEKLYYCVYRESNICINGNIKLFKSFEGYSFCGKTGICKCAKESVSKNVSSAKQNYTEEKKKVINETRVATNVELYGVANTGQTDNAKKAHREFYDDDEKVEAVTIQIKKTKLDEHGDENYNNRPKAEQTCSERYDVKNPWSLTEDKQNPNLEYLKDKEKLSELFPKLSVEEIANQLSVCEGTVYRYLNFHEFRDPYKSTFEKEIIYYLETLGITNIITNKRKLIGKELDIFLPDYNLAIEYNGIYWHHDKISHITKTYHYDKFIACEKLGIELLTIFSDSWANKKDIWKEKIKSKLGLSSTRVFARKTTCEKLTVAQTVEFLNKNHIQGYCVSQICYGLRFNNEIVAMMTFAKNRVGFNKTLDSNIYELVRYATSVNVIGGASKLIKHFVREYNPDKITTYSDNQYSVGALYKVLGFELTSTTKSGYKYYDPFIKKMYHRYNFAKHILVKKGYDPLKTETQIMDERGFLRLWDCGTRTWILDCNKEKQ